MLQDVDPRMFQGGRRLPRFSLFGLGKRTPAWTGGKGGSGALGAVGTAAGAEASATTVGAWETGATPLGRNMLRSAAAASSAV